MAFALGSYTSQFLGIETRVIECCGQDRFIKAGARCADAGRVRDDMFSLCGMKIHAHAEEKLVAEAIGSGEGVVILDLGKDYGKARDYLLRCRTRILLGSVAPWRIGDYIEFQKLVKRYDKHMSFSATGALCGMKEDKKEFRSQGLPPPLSIPLIPNPFQVTYENSQIYRQMIGT